MKLNYSKKDDALYIQFNKNSYRESEEMQEGVIFDYDKNKKIIGIEILDASIRFPRKFKTDFLKHKIPFAINLEKKIA